MDCAAFVASLIARLIPSRAGRRQMAPHVIRNVLDRYVATPARLSVALMAAYIGPLQAAMVGAEGVYLACGNDAFGAIGGTAGHRTCLAVALRYDA
jgi:hypothetical protein